MNKELEVKVLNIDKKEIEENLIAIGAQLLKKEYQVNTIFDTEDRIIKGRNEGYLRIRESKEQVTDKTEYIFTLKKNIGKEGLRENIEIETKVDNKEALVNILEFLGYNVKHRGTKERITYRYDNIIFDIDTWDEATYPYPYLEIEVENREDLERATELLKLNREDITSKSIGELRMEIGMKDL